MMLKNIRIAGLVLALSSVMSASAWAVDGSQEVSAGAASIVLSPLLSIKGGPVEASTFFVAGSALIVIGATEIAGGMVQVVVQNSVNGSKAVFQTAASVAREIGVSVGTGIKYVVEGTGYSLVASGKMLAFIPNAIGQALLYQTKLSN